MRAPRRDGGWLGAGRQGQPRVTMTSGCASVGKLDLSGTIVQGGDLQGNECRNVHMHLSDLRFDRQMSSNLGQ